MKKENKELLLQGFNDLEINIDEKQIELFGKYLDELLKWNSKYNLTAITNEQDVIIKHFLDSAYVSKLLPSKPSAEDNMIDIGSGAGLPGLVVKILCPELHLTSVDSNEKKIFFQKNVVRKLGINHIDFISARVEDTSFIMEYKNSFSCAMARALQSLSDILVYTYPIVKKGGKIFIFKGKRYQTELKDLRSKEISNRFSLTAVESYRLPLIDRENYILVFEKD